jgi:hypothetical protein
MVSLTVLSVLLVIGIQAFQNSRRLSRSAVEQGDRQQSTRIAVDLVTGDLRSTGFGLDMGSGQRGLVHAGPWDIIFNANISPAQDDPMAPGFPGAINLAAGPATVPPGGSLYVPTTTFATGAETIRYTLDSDGDGAVGSADQGDDLEEATPNPRDFVLRKEVYGDRGDGTNGGTGENMGLVRGPVPDPDGTLPTPLFTYFLDDDNDPATPEVLHGDVDSDGKLSQAEIAFLAPIPAADLALVTRVVTTLTTEDGDTGGRPDYRTRNLISSVSFRNQMRRSGLIVGTVFQDSNGDQVFDPAHEPPIPDVVVRLSTGESFETTAMGQFHFETSPGSYTVTEFDPPGYLSTTPNVLNVAVTTGQTVVTEFGDRPGSGVGTIRGKVFEDANRNAALDVGERGIEEVVVSLHTGMTDTTGMEGLYSFEVPVGAYTVVETDSVGWASTTSNAVEVVLTADGQVEVVNFGDILVTGSGTIRGVVFLDEDEDGVHDGGEPGIPDVPILASRGSFLDSTVTNGSGEYAFALPSGNYDMYEEDLSGYSSTTPNTVRSVHLPADSTIVVDFGDILDSSVNFTVVTVGQTDRALSIEAVDLEEDNKGDVDIILGTQLSAGSDNLHVWHNQRRNSATPITALFSPTPTFSRATGHPIPTLLEIFANGDGVPDVLTGLDVGTSPNIVFWVTQSGGGGRGTFPVTPSATFAADLGSTVLSLAESGWPDLFSDCLLVGTVDGSGSGHVEIWIESAPLAYSHLITSDLHHDSAGGLGEITAIEVADFNRDGFPDMAVGQDMGGYQGRVTVFVAGDDGDFDLPWTWTVSSVLWTEGAVLSLSSADMREDDSGDVDLVVGTSRAAGAGGVELWLNEIESGKATFGAAGLRDDWIDSGGEVLSLGLARFDPDIFPDVVAGIRTTQYAGALNVYRSFGYLPSSGTEWSHAGSGEVVTLTISDFNIDGLEDIAVGTRTAVQSGELVVYFGQ